MIKKGLIVLALFLMVSIAASAAEDSYSAEKGDIGIMFHISGFPAVFTPYSDGELVGAGVKYLFSPEFRLRGLLSFSVDPNGDNPSVSNLALSAVGEYHFISGKASPYVGALVGTELIFSDDSTYYLYFGAVAGVELKIYQMIFAYAEYSGLFSFNDQGLGFSFGKNVQLGVIIYL